MGDHIISVESEKPAATLRTPTTKDAPHIWRLVEESGVLDPNSSYLYLLLCRDFANTCLVACHGKNVVGFVTAYRMPHDPSILFVWQIGVAPEAQRQGIAMRLLRELIERCGSTSIKAIEATVAPSNIASQRLFESLAQSHGVQLIEKPEDGFDASDFPPGDHEAEPRIRVELSNAAEI